MFYQLQLQLHLQAKEELCSIIYEWLKNLSGYMLLVTMVSNLLPSEDYRKYIRFFCGLILIVMLSMPLFQLFNIEKDFKEIYQSTEYENMVRELEEADQIVVEDIYEMEE